MSSHFVRAQLLMRQERYEQATEELQKALTEEPDNGSYHAMMAHALLRRDKWQEAMGFAQSAMAKEPDDSFSHWTMAVVWLERNELKEAEAALRSAIELNPSDADYHGLLARVHVESRRFEQAVAAAEQGLALDAENDLCLTFRSRALMGLGRENEATRDADALLANAPDDAWNHCLRGEQLLAQGEPAKAREHYIEALRIDPRNDSARYGLALSLKARNPFYGLFLTILLKLNR